jgi:hypothetical protein
MNPQPRRPSVRVGDPAGLLAIVPHLLGFTPQTSLVVLGAEPPGGRVQVALRYDLPDPPDTDAAAQIAAHAIGVLSRQHVSTVIVAGYGPGALVTPVADATRAAVARAGLRLHDVLRVEDGRYWSYLCREPSCCPAEGVPFDATMHPAAQVLAGIGQPVRADRAALAATIAPLTGSQANSMREATRWAQRAATRLITRALPRGLDAPGRAAVQAAIGTYRDGGSVSDPGRHAWLAVVLTSLPVRDDAWARMDPAHRDAHRRLWTDVVRRVQPGYVAAPASLLAFVAWQNGDGALANLAIDRALADSPGYSMALLLQEALDAAMPPSQAILPMTPEQVAASYADRDTSQPARPPARHARPAAPGAGSGS